MSANLDATYYSDRSAINFEGEQSQGTLAANVWDEMRGESTIARQAAQDKTAGTLDFSTGDIYGKCEKSNSNDRVDRLDDLKKFTDKNFDKIDKDADGFMSEQELKDASQDKCLSEQDRRAIEILQKHSSDIEELSNDEFGDENDGISKADMQQFDDLSTKYTEAGSMYSYLKDNISKVDTDGDGFASSEEINKRIDSLDAKSDERKILENMRDHYDEMQGATNDEWGFDNSGISVEDSLRHASSNAAGFDETGLLMDVKSDLMRYWLDDSKKKGY